MNTMPAVLALCALNLPFPKAPPPPVVAPVVEPAFASADLSLPEGADDDLLTATLFLAEAQALDAKAALDLDEARRFSVEAATVLAGSGAKAEAAEVLASAKTGSFLTPAESAAYRAQLADSRRFIEEQAAEHPGHALLQKARRDIAALLRPRLVRRCR
ncbi:MAG: hypothetical protein SF051_00520 [Elusimicrobiota bacterium]|nr:hypothetical protein [Elusimicrobiota bacterium]